MGWRDLIPYGCRSALRRWRQLGRHARRGWLWRMRVRPMNPDHDSFHEWARTETRLPDRGDATIRANRIHNLQTALAVLDGCCWSEGDVFSLSLRLGEPSERRGYRAGLVFSNGRVSQGSGGGLCLLATNLYQTFFHAGQLILERHAHSIDAYGEARFYPLGLDAALAWGHKDLVVGLAGAAQFYLRLELDLQRGTLISRLLASTPCPFNISHVAQILSTSPPATPDGCAGVVVETQRQISSASHCQAFWRDISDYRAS